MTTNQILTVTEVAHELRCSKAHVYNVIAGKVGGVHALPAISMAAESWCGAALEHWMMMNEGTAGDGTIHSPDIETFIRARTNG